MRRLLRLCTYVYRTSESSRVSTCFLLTSLRKLPQEAQSLKRCTLKCNFRACEIRTFVHLIQNCIPHTVKLCGRPEAGLSASHL